MINFRVFSLPRSGSTWVSNWLTTDKSVCWHDPIEWASVDDIEKWADKNDGRYHGISCTGTWLNDWDTEIPTVVLTRDIGEIQASLNRIGLPLIPPSVVERFLSLKFRKVSINDLMNSEVAADVWGYLLPGVPFDFTRHKELAKMNIQPSANEIAKVKEAINQIIGKSANIGLVRLNPHDDVWSGVRPYLESAIKRSGCSKNWCMDDVIRLAKAGSVILWGVFSRGKMIGSGVTTITSYPKRKVMEVLLFGADIGTSWMELLPIIKSTAKMCGASSVCGTGRPGWARKLKAHENHTWELEV